jgi:hypothetical protein
VIDDLVPELPHSQAVRTRRFAAQQHPGHTERRLDGHVTLQAAVSALESRRGRGLLIQVVEDDAELWVERRRLDESAARPADDDAIVEEERSRIDGTDDPRLHAGFRENGNLRFDRHIERAQHRSQVPAARLVSQRGRTGGELLVQLRDRIVRLLGRIGDGGGTRLFEKRIRQLPTGAESRRDDGDPDDS